MARQSHSSVGVSILKLVLQRLTIIYLCSTELLKNKAIKRGISNKKAIKVTTMLSILRNSIDRSSSAALLLRHQTQTIMNHPSVAHQWQRSLSVLPSMNILTKASNNASGGNLTSSLPNGGQEGIRRLCSTTSPHMPARSSGGSGWNLSQIIINTNSILQSRRHFSSQPPGSGGNLGNIFQHAQNANKNNSKPGQTLEQYGVDLTELAKNGKLDPVIGRHEEIRRTLQILARRTKNNPVLIGEPGVGKC